MATGTKYGKHYTNYINMVIQFIIVLISINVLCFADIPEKKESYIIVIDPGHGGRDPGAIGSYSYEKNITLAVALKTGEYIEQNLKDVKVVYTRKTDTFVDLDVRSDIANKNNADLFISIHANSIDLHNVYGTETFVMGHSKDKANLDVAMKENQVILLESDYSTKYEGFDPKSPESYIMFTLMQNIYLKQSTELASMIQDQYKNKISRFDRGVKQAGFWVLYRTTMPSVLTEIGFISNLAEEKYINSKQGQDNIAESIFRACNEYIGGINKKSGISTAKNGNTVISADSIKATPATKGKIIFMIQVAASSAKIEIKPGNFKNIKDITELYSGNRFRYATGVFNDYDKAVIYRKQIEGIYPDAFVIAVKDNKILPLREALDKK
ncbi:MAG: N-acetylmuramoyl-L-alanine amidase [Odoribacter sp.]|nr:N-acetylmuramoyl-L-alanine amidase [Odoribacter sp.]